MAGKEEGVRKTKEDAPRGQNELYIGVNNDLSPFRVDLNALTRGLVVVGQSGCGKSFLLGRIVEELARNTTDKTRLLVIDSNSDFCEGLKLKADSRFEDDIATYDSGLLKAGEFGSFRTEELRVFKELEGQKALPVGQMFGRKEPFNLSWKWIVEEGGRYRTIVKADSCSGGYLWAWVFLRTFIKKEYECDPLKWTDAGLEILDLRRDVKRDFKYIDPGKKRLIPQALDDSFFLEVIQDCGIEAGAGIWRISDDETGLPERLFADSRVVMVEVETIPRKTARMETVAFILGECWGAQVGSIEKCRELRGAGDKQKDLAAAEQGLKHIFILIDEAQNYAPDGTIDPHEKMLGELIHTIAAEGRKYGIHLILATQRPNKIKRGLLGECDNAIIMKMNSRSDLEHLASEMRILDVKLLEPCLHFQGQGNALAVGEMTRMAPYVQLFKSAPRRTREGGIDIEGF